MRVSLNTDGGVRTGGVNGPTGGKTGRGGIAALIRDEEGTKLFAAGMLLEGESTVNECEFSAIIFGLHNAHKLGAKTVDVYSDSQLVVNQLNGDWKIKQAHLQEYVNEVRVETAKFEKVTFTWIPREKNQQADQIARALLDG